MKQLKSLITIYKLANNLRYFEIGPSDDFVCQYIVEKLNFQKVYKVDTGNFYTKTVY